MFAATHYGGKIDLVLSPTEAMALEHSILNDFDTVLGVVRSVSRVRAELQEAHDHSVEAASRFDEGSDEGGSAQDAQGWQREAVARLEAAGLNGGSTPPPPPPPPPPQILLTMRDLSGVADEEGLVVRGMLEWIAAIGSGIVDRASAGLLAEGSKKWQTLCHKLGLLFMDLGEDERAQVA